MVRVDSRRVPYTSSYLQVEIWSNIGSLPFSMAATARLDLQRGSLVPQELVNDPLFSLTHGEFCQLQPVQRLLAMTTVVVDTDET